MKKLSLLFLLGSVALFGQYKAEQAGPPPPELAPAIAGTLQKDGIKVVAPGGAVWCEVWIRTSAPSGATSKEDNVTLTTVSQGTLLGAIRFPAQGSDRRGQTIKPGVYTMRFSIFPVNGDHQGVAPQRDFLLLSRAADDRDPASAPSYDALVDLSRKVSGTPHPAVLSIWKADDFKPGFAQMGESDWVLQVKVGDVPLAVILVGKVEG